MNQIYVVMSQGNYMVGSKGAPVAAYLDYPSAFAYAKSIFKHMIGSQENPRDLVFLVNISPTVAATPPTVAPTGTVAP